MNVCLVESLLKPIVSFLFACFIVKKKKLSALTNQYIMDVSHMMRVFCDLEDQQLHEQMFGL